MDEMDERGVVLRPGSQYVVVGGRRVHTVDVVRNYSAFAFCGAEERGRGVRERWVPPYRWFDVREATPADVEKYGECPACAVGRVTLFGVVGQVTSG